MALRLHRFIPFTRVEGPGNRACIQVQGCSIRCKGCAVPFTWEASGGIDVDPDELAANILADPRLEGVTFLGGEPFEQAGELCKIAAKVKANGLSVMTFSGMVYEELVSANRPDWNELLSYTDLLIDGPFQEDLPDTTLPWRGSANQRYLFLTDRYKQWKAILNTLDNKLEITIHKDGRLFVNGLATSKEMLGLFAGLHEK